MGRSDALREREDCAHTRAVPAPGRLAGYRVTAGFRFNGARLWMVPRTECCMSGMKKMEKLFLEANFRDFFMQRQHRKECRPRKGAATSPARAGTAFPKLETSSEIVH